MSHIGQIVVVGGDDGGVGGAVALLMLVFFKQDFITLVFETAVVVVLVLSFFLTVFRVECKFSLLFEKLLSLVNLTLVFMSFMVWRLRL